MFFPMSVDDRGCEEAQERGLYQHIRAFSLTRTHSQNWVNCVTVKRVTDRAAPETSQETICSSRPPGGLASLDGTVRLHAEARITRKVTGATKAGIRS